MRKILFHAGMSPLDRPAMRRIFYERLFTTNSGNLLFQYGVYRTLLTEDTQITSRFLDRRNMLSPEKLEEVNSGYDCVILPMANNFRGSYDLKTVTKFIQGLKIPCVVTGIGLQTVDPARIQTGFPFDDDVKAFVSATLDHSATLGLRGEFTAEYLEKLGFSPERHFTVTGCPSMLSAGVRLPQPRVKALTADSPISVNYRKEQPENLLRFMEQTQKRMPHTLLTVQRVEEMGMMRYGLPLKYMYGDPNADLSRYPHDASHPAMREGRMLGFTSARTWIDTMKTVDLSIGCRIHGNIAAVLAGTPALVLTIDSRTEELCRYHGIPFIPAAQFDPDTDVRDLMERVDFTSPQRGHEQRVRHFLDFLDANGVGHIYKNTLEPEKVPLDEAIKALEPGWGLIRSQARVPLSAHMEGWGLYYKRKLRGKLGFLFH